MWFAPTSDQAFALLVFLGNLAVAASLAAGGALAANRFFCRAALPLRNTLLLAGLGLTLAAPFVVTAGHRLGVARIVLWLPAGSMCPAQVPDELALRVPSRGAPRDQIAEATAAATPRSASPSTTQAPSSPRPAIAVARWASAAQWLPGLGGALAALWIIGICWQLCRLAQGVVRVSKLLAGAMPVRSPSLMRLASAAARKAGLRRAPLLLESSRLAAPVSLGVLRPRVVLPALDRCRWSDEEWQLMLLHEMAHLRRRDPWIGFGQRLATAIHWWNPLVRALSRKISQVREQLCDDVVAAQIDEPRRYAALIVNLAERMLQSPSTVPGAVGIADGTPSELTVRIERLLDARREIVTQLSRRAALMALALTLGVALVTMAVGVRVAQAVNREVEPAPADRTEQPTEPEASPPASDPAADAGQVNAGTPLLEKRIRVVNAQGKPIAGAQVDTWAAHSVLGHSLWRGSDNQPKPELAVTDANGQATLRYPALMFAAEKVRPERLTCSITHPDYAGTSHTDVDVRDAGQPNAVQTITLERGAQLVVMPDAGDRVVDRQYLYLLDSAPALDYRQPLKYDSDGRLLPPRVPAGTLLLRLAYLPDDGPALFSPVQQIDLANDERREIRLTLEPCARVTGRLDDSVPRPVREGRINAATVHRVASNFWQAIDWRAVATIDGDGNFMLEGLPRGDLLQVIAVCDGYIARSGTMPERGVVEPDRASSGLLRPQAFPLAAEANAITVAMTPTATCRIQVQGPEGQPLAGAECIFSPNVHWWDGGSQIYCDNRVSSRDILRDASRRGIDAWINPRAAAAYRGLSDAAGVAEVRNLPAGEEALMIVHSNFELPIGPGAYRAQRVNLTSGATTETSVRLQSKGHEFLGDSGEVEEEFFEPVPQPR
ncbi:MAG: hypothetical protein K1X74_14520 [Pirellulales bacterium]|nr:hypothetical protein [Pirellulales bacterium]